jgi:ABC-type sulfate transport system permease component
LLLAFFAAIVWWVVSQGWLDVRDRSAMAWVVLLVLGVVLGIGMSWSHVRRKLSGQASVDRVDK